jgi:hypothetical protein
VIPTLLLLVGLSKARESHEARLEPPRVRDRPSTCDLELRLSLWRAGRGGRPWSGRTPLSEPGWHRDEPVGPADEGCPADAPPEPD